MDLIVELDRLKEWARRTSTPAQDWDAEYPDWPKLMASAREALRRRPMNPDLTTRLLEALALDHEAESLRDTLVEEPEQGILLARAGLAYPNPDARWQIADFLGTLNQPEANALLRRLVADPDEYVRRRALLAIQHHDPAFAEEVAASWLAAEHEYSRLAALSVLSDLKSKHLASALELLKDDPSPMVRNKAATLKSADGT
jgi:HEAT repeat protein